MDSKTDINSDDHMDLEDDINIEYFDCGTNIDVNNINSEYINFDYINSDTKIILEQMDYAILSDDQMESE